MKQLALLFLLFLILESFSQSTNILSTNPLAEQIMLGNYNPATYAQVTPITHPDSISRKINQWVNPDSLKAYIIQLSTFRNRNTGADTLSNITGVGAARRWVYSKFQQFSASSENRLIPSYLQFNQSICSMSQHRNIFCVLPGSDTTDKSILLIEGHIDSRCEGSCDINCNAQGIEDNASGTALVMELARVMSKFTFKHTIVFVATIGEEQGLYGAEAFADYVQQKGILMKAVQNNDVIGGIICGQTSSPPSCPFLNHIDSTNVRLFSYGSFNSPHKGYCRFIKLEYKEQLIPYLAYPNIINIMSPEDRTGRGGDHIPFRQHNYTAMRLTSANEHGDANVSNMSYADRQHTTRDTLGVDTNNDQVVDSFFVDFNYLKRNAVINGNALAMCALGPKQPDFQVTAIGVNQIRVQVTQQTQYGQYRVGIRTSTHDWDTVFTMTNTLIDTFTVVPPTNFNIYVQVMSVDADSVESVPSVERLINVSSTGDVLHGSKDIELMYNKPNPFDEATWLTFYSTRGGIKGTLFIHDIAGKELRRIIVQINAGMNEVLYEHGYGMTGILTWKLEVEGKTVGSRTMTFAN
ncbi:MAG: M28 family peptidase [Bacteroidia bacterium]|nr:M28 family peptidase [Bacteroidia bacterium]